MTPNTQPAAFDFLLEAVRDHCGPLASLEIRDHDPRYAGPSVRVRHPLTERVLSAGVVPGTTSFDISCRGSSWSYVQPERLREAVEYHAAHWSDTWRP